jgi:hypothetical protein
VAPVELNIIPRWLSLKQAVAYCPYSKHKLKQLAMEKKIKAGKQTDKKTEAWFFDRLSLDKYMESMLFKDQDAELQEGFLDFKRRAG